MQHRVPTLICPVETYKLHPQQTIIALKLLLIAHHHLIQLPIQFGSTLTRVSSNADEFKKCYKILCNLGSTTRKLRTSIKFLRKLYLVFYIREGLSIPTQIYFFQLIPRLSLVRWHELISVFLVNLFCLLFFLQRVSFLSSRLSRIHYNSFCYRSIELQLAFWEENMFKQILCLQIVQRCRRSYCCLGRVQSCVITDRSLVCAHVNTAGEALQFFSISRFPQNFKVRQHGRDFALV